MDTDNQEIKVRINNFNLEHFKGLGYDVKINDNIIIKTCELPNGSGIKVDVKCKYCKKIFKKPYRKYLETKDDICCDKCKTKKCEKTNIKRYGNKCSLRNKDILDKAKQTNIKKLGVEYPFQNKEILKKCIKTSSKKYGINYRKHSTSKQQLYIYNLYGGILNYNIGNYFLDIYFKDSNIYFEYDGSSHNLGVRLGTFTIDEFNKNELNREKFLYDLGIKEFRIISGTDKLPSDAELISIKNKAFEILINQDFYKYTYNIDTKMESFEK